MSETSVAVTRLSDWYADLPPLQRGLRLAAEVLFYLVGAYFFFHLSRYFVTGAGGPTLLAVVGVPLTICIVYLNDLRRGDLYPRLGHVAPFLIALVYCAICLYAIHYLVREFDEIRIYRLGLWNTHDLAVGVAVAALVMEYTRRRYFALFVLNILLILYTVYGYLVPGLFNHPGMTWNRVASAVSVEMSTGVFERLPQLGLTLIGSFILVLAALRAFGCIDSILLGSTRIAVRSPRLLPQAAVIGSFGVAAVSGSGAANAATTGTATIPVLIKAGFPRVTAAAVETASSLGGQLMPPLMGIAAFLMADYLGTSYFEVVARGFAPAIIFYIGVAFAVWMLAGRYYKRAVSPRAEPMNFMDWANIAAYFIAVAGLIYFMGVERRPAMAAAQTVFSYLFIFLALAFIVRSIKGRKYSFTWFTRPLLRMIESYASITAELTILLATLGILTATFTITGVPTKVGILLMEGAGINLALMVLVGFGFGYIIGMGLPVAPTYIIIAIVVSPFMIRAGVDPWVVHFFAFMVAVFGELSPPTSVTAAVTSRIAEAPFVRTMMVAMVICMPLMLMMGAVFTRPELVVTPGLAQLPAFVLVLIGTLAISFALQGSFGYARGPDILLRLVLAGIAGGAVFHPDNTTAAAFAAPALAMSLFGVWRYRRYAV
ncbi:TRAP transporter, 4TM/12TM fusion protein [Thioalkalivibrio sulfidiphilus HL-EbGr7]|uniref:TRAP transporter, 4TM/12TM fusion protein n=1 Tax=Thioalkalivibrio sulfidiphilus (strain HL-EbGR7) TaxID=396588 RepID=B8GRY0_THISH|nr:TRAP transporter fused permease subunit [Thioalkalivibrio sulfidiphilus]ACL72684.1 TRAP transporter, 4TM/12TM fusion protein [Thioalkalivibrio sulfidiphilus HL-EbGr7]